VLRLLPQAADGVDHALGAGLKRLDLALHQVLVHFGEGPIDKGALLRQPIDQWPKFTLKLNPLGVTRDLSLSETWAGAQTMVGGLGANPGETPDVRARCIQALGAICYELLGGTLSPLGFGTSGGLRYTPLATLSEEGNNVLRRSLDPAISYPTAYEFFQSLHAIGGLELPRHETPTATVAPRAPKPPVQTLPPLRRKFPIGFFSGVATIAVIATAIYYFAKDAPKVTPEIPGPAAESAAAAVQAAEEEETPPPTPAAEAIVMAPEVETGPPAEPSRQDLLHRASADAEALQADGKSAEAIAAWLRIAKEFPDFQKGRVQLEELIGDLRKRDDEVNQKELPQLRDPITQAAQADVLAAILFLGEHLRGVDPVAAFQWSWYAAYAKGDLSALTQTGLMYSSGVGTEKDLGKAITAFQEGAEKGHAAAKTALADCYLYGKNVPKDEKRATALLAEAVAQGDGRAMDMLGTCHHQGVGVAVDYEKAMQLYGDAAEVGFHDALGNLGVLYIRGRASRRRTRKRPSSFSNEGVAKGSALCMYFLALSYEQGIGVQPNSLQKVAWYKRAAEAGNRSAADWCRKIKCRSRRNSADAAADRAYFAASGSVRCSAAVSFSKRAFSCLSACARKCSARTTLSQRRVKRSRKASSFSPAASARCSAFSAWRISPQSAASASAPAPLFLQQHRRHPCLPSGAPGAAGTSRRALAPAVSKASPVLLRAGSPGPRGRWDFGSSAGQTR
jgi:TPR repeat protein